MFTGFVWSGEKAMVLGLLNDCGSTYSVEQKVIGESESKDLTPLVPWIERLARGVGASLGLRFWVGVVVQPGFPLKPFRPFTRRRHF